jgi:ATP-dependent DNA helicase PIF1
MPLNQGQKVALDTILEGHNVFLTGPGGTGKSFLIQTIKNEFENKGKKIAVTALTGCAALLLGKEAKTIHSWAGIGLGKEPATKIAADIRKLPWKNKVLRRWLLTSALIIDEVSMMTQDILNLLNNVAQQVRRRLEPFGGIQLILVGDWCQLPPVVKRDGHDKALEQELLFETTVWEEFGFKVCHLAEIVRQDDPVFHEVLGEARYGSLSDKSLQVLMDRQKVDWSNLKIKPTLLFSRRADVEMVNETNMKALKGPTQRYEVKTIFDAKLAKGLSETTPEVQRAISKLDRDAPYKPSLELKKGAQVMLIYNLDQEAGLVNGSRGVIEGFTETTPPLPLVLFKGQSEVIPITPMSWESDEIEGVKREQMPIIHAWACTIHKSQGATLDCALVDLGPSTFEMGQAYVALSRVKSLESLYIYDLDPAAFKANKRVVEYYKSLPFPQTQEQPA